MCVSEGEGGLKDDSQVSARILDPWVEQEAWLQVQLAQGYAKGRQKQCLHFYDFHNSQETVLPNTTNQESLREGV